MAEELKRRNNSPIWHVDFTAASGERIRRATGTTIKREAEEFLAKLKTDLWRQFNLGEKQKRLFDEAALRMLNESQHLSSFAGRKIHLRYWSQFFSGRELDTISKEEIFENLPVSSQRTKDEKPLSLKTRNAYLGTIRHLFNLAVDWGWLAVAPRLKDAQVVNKRVRWLMRHEAHRLISAISTDWLRDVAILGFATGLRRANLLGLRWDQVNLVERRAWFEAGEMKARKALGVPLNDDAIAVIRRWLGKHPTHVFSRRGRVIPTICSEQWNRQVKRAGIEHFRFHDIRHTWASWHVQAGTPLNRLMELGGWSKYEHVLRYAHLAPNHLAQHADAVRIWTPGDGNLDTNPAQSETVKPESLAA